MQAAALGCDLVKRSPQNRIELANIKDQAGLIVAHPVQIKFLCLPRLPELRKPVGISRRLECFLCDNARYLMVPVTVARRSGKTGNDDFGFEVTNDPDKISKHQLMGPFGERVIRALRKAKLVIGREKLLRMIEPARAVELFGADDAKRLKQFTADKIHAAFPSCGGEVCGACALSSSEPCQQRAVFVIRMRSGVKHAANHIQPLECLRQTHGTAVFGDFGARRNHGGNCGQHNDDPQEDFRSSKPHREIP